MIRKIALVLGSLLSLASHHSLADEIVIAPNELTNLGVEFASPERAQDVVAVEATARVVIPPAGDTVISAPQAGMLAMLNMGVGDEVRRGQVLAKMRSPDFLALQGEFLDSLNANLLAQNEYERDQQLFDEGIISGRRLQETTTRSRIATTRFSEHRQLLQIAGLTEAEINSLETQQKMLPVLEIRAPFDGVILERMATAGERLDAMSPVYRLADLSTLWLEIFVPQESLSAVRLGMKVAVTGSPVRLPGEVTTIGRSIDPATQAIMVRATLTDAGHGLKPGQFVSAQIVAGYAGASGVPVWSVPTAAVTRSNNGHYLFVRSEKGLEVREVQVVSSDSVNLFFSSKIEANDQVAISGVAALKALWHAQSESES